MWSGLELCPFQGHELSHDPSTLTIHLHPQPSILGTQHAALTCMHVTKTQRQSHVHQGERGDYTLPIPLPKSARRSFVFPKHQQRPGTQHSSEPSSSSYLLPSFPPTMDTNCIGVPCMDRCRDILSSSWQHVVVALRPLVKPSLARTNCNSPRLAHND